MRKLTPRYSLLMAFYWANYAVLSNYASVYLLGHHFSNTAIGTLIAVSGLAAAVFQPLLGIYADRPHSPSVRVILFALTGAFLAATAMIPIFAGRAAVPLSIVYAAALTLMLSMSPLNNALGTLSAASGARINFGIARGIGSLAYAIVSVLIGRYTAARGIEGIPIISFGLYALFEASLILFPFRKTTVSSKNADNTDGFLKRYPTYIPVLIAAVCLYTSHVLVNSFAYQIIVTKGGDSQSLGLAYAIAAVMELPLMFIFTRLLRFLSAGKWLIISGFAYTIKSLGTLLVTSIGGYYAVQLLQLPSFAVITVASVYYVNDIMKPQDAVKGQAFFTMTYTIGTVFASFIGGILLDQFGVQTLLKAALGFSIAGAFIMWRGIRESGGQVL